MKIVNVNFEQPFVVNLLVEKVTNHFPIPMTSLDNIGRYFKFFKAKLQPRGIQSELFLSLGNNVFL